MSRLEEVKDFIAKQPTHISGTNEECIAKIELMKLHVLQDIDLSLAQLVDIFKRESDREDERDKREKGSVKKSCENCFYDPNDKLDISMACGYCYDYNNWEEKEC